MRILTKFEHWSQFLTRLTINSEVKEAFKKVQNLEIFPKFIWPHPTPTLLFSTGFHCYFFYLNVEEEILHPLPKKINSNMNSWVIQGNFLCSNGSASLFIKFTKDLKLFWLELRIWSLQSKILELLFWDKRRVRYWWNPCLPLLRNAKVVVSFICVHKLENLLIAIEP